MIWNDILDPADPELDRLASEYHIHPLHIEDCRNRDQRGKVEDNENYIFTVLKPVTVDNDVLVFHDLDIFLGNDWVITVEETACDTVRKILQPIHAAESRLRPDQIFHRICDGVVDSYLPLLDRTDEIIDELEEQVLEDPTPQVLARIFETKRSLIELRRILVNTRDVTAHLYRAEHVLIPPELTPFLRDVYDHVARDLDLVETQRDLLTGIMDVYLSSVANRTNEVVKVLTILGTIALPVLVVSGYFGMNTKGLPFTVSPYGTLIVTVMMVAATVGLLIYLRKHRWI